MIPVGMSGNFDRCAKLGPSMQHCMQTLHLVRRLHSVARMHRTGLVFCALLALFRLADAARFQRADDVSVRGHGASAQNDAVWNPPQNSTYKNYKPLIGIMTQPCHECPGRSYIAAGFVKWIESAGGRAVPIRFYASDDELHRIFKSINGIVFPGGLTWLWLDSPYVNATRKLFNWAVEANNNGDVFPIHGTCLGFQLLHILASNISRNDLLVDTDSVSHATTLMWQLPAEKSRLFKDLPTPLFDKLADPKYNITLENHMYGLPPAYYDKYPILKEWYTIVSTTKDRNGTEYSSTIEGTKYPFTGTQWHPEKPPFEFGIPEVPHSLDSIRISQHIANIFIDTARLSSHRPESHEEELALQIYDTPPIFSARFEVMGEDNYDGPDMTYYFDTSDKPPHGPEDSGDEDGEHKYRQYLKWKASKHFA